MYNFMDSARPGQDFQSRTFGHKKRPPSMKFIDFTLGGRQAIIQLGRLNRILERHPKSLRQKIFIPLCGIASG
jgi:hypothetical protein